MPSLSVSPTSRSLNEARSSAFMPTVTIRYKHSADWLLVDSVAMAAVPIRLRYACFRAGGLVTNVEVNCKSR
jgi:hypothetical protein